MLSRLISLLNVWALCDLTPTDRITTDKSFGVSQVVYSFQNLPDPPTAFIKKGEQAIFFNLFGLGNQISQEKLHFYPIF